MTYTTQNDIAPGQITLHRGNVFIAALRDGLKPCIEQCDCRLPGRQSSDRCDGFCLRWRNSKDVVFHALPDEAATQATVVETPFMAAIRQAKEQEKQTNKI